MTASEQPEPQQLDTSLIEAGPPNEYDAASVGRVASRVEIQSVELVATHFERLDTLSAFPLPISESSPEIGMSAEWQLSEDGSLLGCIVSCVAYFSEGEEVELGKGPYNLVARFRLVYGVKSGEALEPEAVSQFANWNAVFNAWPYWRELLASMIERGQLPRFTLPVLGLPRAIADASRVTEST
jgi:hypothetical protein